MLRPFARGFILLTSRNTKQEIKNKKIPQFFVAAIPFFIAITFTMYFIHTNNYKAFIRCAFHVFPVSHFLAVLNSVTLSLCSSRYFSIAVDSSKIKLTLSRVYLSHLGTLTEADYPARRIDQNVENPYMTVFHFFP